MIEKTIVQEYIITTDHAIFHLETRKEKKNSMGGDNKGQPFWYAILWTL